VIQAGNLEVEMNGWKDDQGRDDVRITPRLSQPNVTRRRCVTTPCPALPFHLEIFLLPSSTPAILPSSPVIMASSSVAGPSATSPASALALLTNLPISHPSFSSLLVGHTPLASSSSLPHQPLNKLLGRINTAILSRENESDRRIGWGLAREVIHQDSEGYALLQYGKGWVTASIAAVTVRFHCSNAGVKLILRLPAIPQPMLYCLCASLRLSSSRHQHTRHSSEKEYIRSWAKSPFRSRVCWSGLWSRATGMRLYVLGETP